MQQISAFESATLFSCVCVFLSHPVVDGKCLFKEEADFYEILNITSFQVWLLCVQATPADGLCRWRGPNGCLQPKHVQWTRALQVSRDVFPPLPTAQCLNSAAKNYLCYVSWLRMCQLLTVLTGVVLNSLKKVPGTLIGLVGTSHLIKHTIRSIWAISDFRFL